MPRGPFWEFCLPPLCFHPLFTCMCGRTRILFHFVSLHSNHIAQRTQVFASLIERHLKPKKNRVLFCGRLSSGCKFVLGEPSVKKEQRCSVLRGEGGRGGVCPSTVLYFADLNCLVVPFDPERHSATQGWVRQGTHARTHHSPSPER